MTTRLAREEVLRLENRLGASIREPTRVLWRLWFAHEYYSRCGLGVGEIEMGNVDEGLSGLADYLHARREEILSAWRKAIQKDPALTTSDSLPRADLYD